MTDVNGHQGSRRCGAAAYEVDMRLAGPIEIEPFSWTATRVDGRSF